MLPFREPRTRHLPIGTSPPRGRASRARHSDPVGDEWCVTWVTLAPRKVRYRSQVSGSWRGFAVVDAPMTTDAMPRDVAVLLTSIGIAVIVAVAFLAFVAIS